MNQRNLILITDLGRDLDDFLTICYAKAIGYSIIGMDIFPGDPDQIAVAKLICRELSLDCKVAAAKPNRDKLSSGGAHYQLLDKYRFPKAAQPDGPGSEIIREAHHNYPDCDFLCIGPVTSLAKYMEEDGPTINRLVMQGGFLSYNMMLPCKPLAKFEGVHRIGTFNLNGDVKAAQTLINYPVADKRFVGKNVCHGMTLTKDRLQNFAQPTSRSGELFMEAANLYFNKHQEKNLHDPTALFLLNNPDRGSWVQGRPYREKGEWATALRADTTDQVLYDIDHDAFWRHLHNWGQT